jgi:hypothetical protein
MREERAKPMVSVTSLPTCPETNGLGGPSEARDRQLLSHRCLEVDVLLGSRRFVWKSTFQGWMSPFQDWELPFQGWESPFQGWESPFQGWKSTVSGSGVVGPKTAQSDATSGDWWRQ